MNKYLDAQVTWDHPERVKPNQMRHKIPMDLPDYFKCPSDKSAGVPMAGATGIAFDADTPFLTWEWWGTSYPINWYWAYCFYPPAQRLIGSATGGPEGVLDGSRHKQLLKSKEVSGAAEWIMFYENQMNFAMEGARPRGAPDGEPRIVTGWHRQENMHAAAFFDGHAKYGYFDTTYIDGPAWTTWPSRNQWMGTPSEPYIDQ
jgi:hypothetical protein